jgi:hypothetical protein
MHNRIIKIAAENILDSTKQWRLFRKQSELYEAGYYGQRKGLVDSQD